jgi:transcriptional regulator with XRE-family HTH domain
MNTKPFTETLAGLLEERDWSLRELSRQMEADGERISHVTLSALSRGVLPPSKRAMELIAKACRVDPAVFAEWRLEAKRLELDWRTQGLKRALRALGE